MSTVYRVNDTGSLPTARDAWGENAAALAQWVFAYLVNRDDRYGGYYEYLGGHDLGAFAATAAKPTIRSRTVHECLTLDLVKRHFRAFGAKDVIGIHSVSPNDTCKWVELDIDQHEAHNDDLALRNRHAALTWYQHLVDLDFQPLLWHSNGRGGFRINVRFHPAMPCPEAYSFGHWLVKNWKQYGLPKEPDVFPKQPSIQATEKQEGNWVRLPGRHPKRAFWPEIFDGNQWLTGTTAIEFLLTFAADSPELVPDEGRQYHVKVKKAVEKRAGAAFFLPDTASKSPVLARAKAILRNWKLPQEGERNSTLYQAGCVIGERLPISEEDHLAVLIAFNSRFDAPLAQSEVQRTSRSAFHATAAKRGRIVYSPSTVEDYPPAAPENLISLDEYRTLLAETYRTVLTAPGIYLDTTPPGVGKTHQGLLLAAQCPSSLHVIPTHRSKDDVAERLVSIAHVDPIDIGVFPERTEENCRRMAEVKVSYQYGTIVPAALCVTCEFSRDCPHLQQRAAAEQSLHTVGTMARLEQDSLARVGMTKALIRVDEDALRFLRPMVKASLPAIKKLRMVVEAAAEFAAKAEDPHIRSTKAFLLGMRDWAGNLLKTAKTADQEISIPLKDGIGAPRALEFVVKKGFEIEEIKSKRDELAQAKRLLVGLTSGEVRRCVLQVHKEKGDLTKSVVGVWHTDLPRNQDGSLSSPILFSDATANPNILRRVLGEEVVDITPRKAIRHQQRVLQIPLDIKRTTKSSTFLQLVRGILLTFPNKRRVGLIGHRPHVQAIDQLGATLRPRIVKTTYFGSGDDRASNAWLEENLDLLLVIGTPRIAPADLRTRMIQLGLDSVPAARWVNRYWRGRTEHGEPIEVVTRQYDHPLWQEVYEYDLRATLFQALGRARTILPNGMDAVIVSCEPLGLSLADQIIPQVSGSLEKALDVVIGQTSLEVINLPPLLMQLLGVKIRRAREIIAELIGLAVLQRWARGSYRLAPPWDNQPDASAP